MLRHFIVLSLFVSSVYPIFGPPININFQVDRCLAEYNSKAASTGATSMALSDFKVDPVEGKGVTVSDLSTIRRRGDAYMWVDGTVHKFQIRVGWDVFVEDIKELTFGDETMHAQFTVEDNLMLWEFTMNITPTSCSMTWDKYEWEKMDKVTMFSDNPKYNNMDVSAIFNVLVMPHVNMMQRNASFRTYLEREMNFCEYARRFL